MFVFTRWCACHPIGMLVTLVGVRPYLSMCLLSIGTFTRRYACHPNGMLVTLVSVRPCHPIAQARLMITPEQEDFLNWILTVIRTLDLLTRLALVHRNDLRPTAKPLWRPIISVYHLGILKAIWVVSNEANGESHKCILCG
ncbi:hypothetical protein CFP56_013452 [Quercus suber]|uniref:Secreted protein n=1 Tax=Quercus suber TaxID=58331 RepID=A0AAW0KT41_QUESU